MRRFYCHCGQEVFFNNTHCGVCGSQLGFSVEQRQLKSLEATSETGIWTFPDDNRGKHYKVCSHREHLIACNWLIASDSPETQCESCALTRVIPPLNKEDNWRRWRNIESSKRRMIYGLLRLNLPIYPRHKGINNGLVFDFLEDQRSNPQSATPHVLNGHATGLITLNVAEADGSFREATREAMNEPYRTLLGHFRHEIGHFYWDNLIKGSSDYAAFCQQFNYSEQNYQQSLNQYYADGPPDDWREHYISAYSSAHPMEDWAETWAHYMMMIETMETAGNYELLANIEEYADFTELMADWMSLVVKMNAINRSIGNRDAYPFVVSETVQNKIEFIHHCVTKSKNAQGFEAFQ